MDGQGKAARQAIHGHERALHLLSAPGERAHFLVANQLCRILEQSGGAAYWMAGTI